MPTRRNLLAALGLLAFPPAPAPAGPAAWPGFRLIDQTRLSAAPGMMAVEWVLQRRGSPNSLVTLVWASVNGPTAAMGVTEVERRGPSRGLYRGATPPTVAAAINGSFFEGTGATERSMGLVRLARVTRHPTSARTGGGFLIADGRRVRIVDRAQAAVAEAAPTAVESSPILVTDGASGMRRDDHVRADRVAAGVTRSGALVLIGAFGSSQDTVSLLEFEQLARAAAAALGETIADLIAMDGGPSAHLILPASGRFYGAASSIYLTDLVTITP